MQALHAGQSLRQLLGLLLQLKLRPVHPLRLRTLHVGCRAGTALRHCCVKTSSVSTALSRGHGLADGISYRSLTCRPEPELQQ